jgi:PPOX class probable FMN-dependent enzyme
MSLTFKSTIDTIEELRDIMGYPNEVVTRKTIDHIDEICRAFIEKSPFITIATADTNNNLDVSPKGDPPGFVKILDNKTLAIPDRPGNRKADSLRNIIQNPNIGLIFFIPGIKETLRINGKAKVIVDEDILQALICKGKVPSFAIIVEVSEAFMHCAKCIIRSNLWTSPEGSQQARPIPTLGEVLVEHGKLDMEYEELDQLIKDDEQTNLY